MRQPCLSWLTTAVLVLASVQCETTGNTRTVQLRWLNTRQQRSSHHAAARARQHGGICDSKDYNARKGWAQHLTARKRSASPFTLVIAARTGCRCEVRHQKEQHQEEVGCLILNCVGADQVSMKKHRKLSNPRKQRRKDRGVQAWLLNAGRGR